MNVIIGSGIAMIIRKRASVLVLKPVYHQFDWPAQDYNNVGIYTGCGPESFGSWYPVTNAWGGIYFVVVYEAKEYGEDLPLLVL